MVSVTDSRASETSSPRPRPGLPAAGRPRRTAQHAVQVRQIGDADRDRFALVVAGVLVLNQGSVRNVRPPISMRWQL